MLTIELMPGRDGIEIHGDREGLLLLAQNLIDLAAKSSADHIHMMTAAWGGSGLNDVCQSPSNESIKHAKLVFWPNGVD
jgi:hypothetical protein